MYAKFRWVCSLTLIIKRYRSVRGKSRLVTFLDGTTSIRDVMIRRVSRFKDVKIGGPRKLFGVKFLAFSYIWHKRRQAGMQSRRPSLSLSVAPGDVGLRASRIYRGLMSITIFSAERYQIWVTIRGNRVEFSGWTENRVDRCATNSSPSLSLSSSTSTRSRSAYPRDTLGKHVLRLSRFRDFKSFGSWWWIYSTEL